MKKKVAVLVSGGVDSSVALCLLKEQGYELTAVYLKIWLEDELSFIGQCPWEEDLSYVRAVCDQLNIPLHIINLQQEYHDHIVSYVLTEIKAGRTPNPDMMCNKYVKFGAVFDHLDQSLDQPFDYVATGHYAQTRQHNGELMLCSSPDPVKDQTYFLAQVPREQLARVLFPIGHLDKTQVRALAHQFNLPTKDRKDSQGICFLGKIKFDEFIKHHLGTTPGDIVEVETGKKLGTHEGFYFYTLGQRQGLRLAGGPWYVVKKDSDTNTVFISREYYAEDKVRNHFFVRRCNWMNGAPTEELPQKNLSVKLRHGPVKNECTIKLADQSTLEVSLAQRDQGIAPGQFAVFYDGDICLGSGEIC